MLEELKEEGIVNKIGGRFKLSTLIQKRRVMSRSSGLGPVSWVASSGSSAAICRSRKWSFLPATKR